jgi:hypothetical protein
MTPRNRFSVVPLPPCRPPASPKHCPASKALCPNNNKTPLTCNPCRSQPLPTDLRAAS